MQNEKYTCELEGYLSPKRINLCTAAGPTAWSMWAIVAALSCLGILIGCGDGSEDVHDPEAGGSRHSGGEHHGVEPGEVGHVEGHAEDWDVHTHAHDHHEAVHEGHEEEHHHDAVHEELHVRRLHVDREVSSIKAAVQDFTPYIRIPAEISVDPDRRVSISTPVKGRVLSLDVPLHACVRAGQRLCTIEILDPEVRRLQIEAVKARAGLVAARTEKERLERYLDNISPTDPAMADERRRIGTNLAVSDAKVYSLEKELEAILTSLKASGLSASQVERLKKKGQITTRISLQAPALPGRPLLEVVDRKAVLGETVEAGAELYRLVGLDRLLVVGEAFERDLSRVREAATRKLDVTVAVPSSGKEVAGLKIHALEGALGGQGRVTHFFVWLPNKGRELEREKKYAYMDWDFRAGGRARVLVPVGEAVPRIILPSSCSVQHQGKTWFVVKRGGHELEARALEPEILDDTKVVLRPGHGIEPGDDVVDGNVLPLLLKVLKGTNIASEGHGHHHHHHHH